MSEWPDGPYPFDVHVGLKGSEVGEGGGTRNLEIVRVESLNYETNEITLLRRTTGSSYGYMGVSYGGGSTATTAAALLAIHEIRIGTDSTGAWERFMCAKRINGIRDDIGITNGAAVKPRDWPPFKANGERVTTRGDRTTHFLQGYWGHRSYWNPAYGVAEYKDWVPPNPVNSNNYVRTDVFEGQSVWIQFRSKLNANRILLGTAKHFFIQNDMSGHGQFVWNAGGDPDNVRPDGRGSRLVPYTQYNDSAAHEPSTLVMPPSWPGEVTKDNSTFGYRVHHQEDYPLATYPTLTSADAGWRFPGNVWVTYMIHFDFGRDNAVQPWVDYNTNLAANRAQEKVPEPAAYDADYRTEIKVFVAEPGDTKWKRIIDYPSYAWMFGDDKNHAGHYQQNPPGLSMLQFGSFGNIYIGSGGQPPPKGTTAVEFTDIIVSREPLPIPDVGVMPSDYIPEPAVPPSFTPSPPAPATGHYTDGMQPFEVRQLTGAYAPLGAATFRASQPPPWNGSARFQTEGIISAWSGGVYDPTTKRLFFSGGGHSDGANNGWHVFDWSGTTRPLGFYTLEGSRSEGSALDSIVSYWRVGAYADGKPNAVHTYSNVVYSQSRRRIYRGNSSSWPDVNNGQVPLAPSGFYWFDEDTGTYGNYPIDINDTGGILILSPDESKIFANRPLSGTDNGFFDMSTGAFTSFSISLFSGSWDPSYCYDPTRNRYLLVGYNSPTLVVYLLSINWAANTATKTQVSLASHAGILSAAMGIVYDEQEDCFWALGGKESTGGVITQIARIDAETLEASAFPLSTPIPKNAVGQYGRIAWLQEHRAIGLVAAHDQPAAVVKLP